MDFVDMEAFEAKKIKELTDGFESSDVNSLDIKMLYPEFEFSDVYGIKSNDVHITKYLVIYDQIIVNVPPLKSEPEFEEFHGIAFNQFIELVISKKILPVICFPFSDYPVFYARLFEQGSFPRSGRLRELLAELSGKNKKELFARVLSLMERADFSANIQMYFRDYHGDKKSLFANSFTSDLYDFAILGLDELIDIVFDISEFDPEFGHQVLFEYSELLVKPLFDNLDGINTFTDSHLQKAKSLYLKTEKLKMKLGNNRRSDDSINRIESYMGINPAELIRFIGTDMPVTLPSNVLDKVKFVQEIDREPVIQEMRKSIINIKISKFDTSSIETLRHLGTEITSYLEKDVKRLQLISSYTADAILFGAILPSIAGQILYENKMVNLFYSTVLPTFAGTKFDAIKEFSRRFTGSFFTQLMKKPLATTYWQQNRVKGTTGVK